LEAFTHSLNPYIGCGYGRPVANPGGVPMGCPYCYVRRLPVSGTRPAPWGTWVIAKEGAAEQLREEVRRWRRTKRRPLRIFFGTSTDPYQPVEGRLLITREILAAMVDEEVDWVLLQTRSPMVLRDLDLLRLLGDRVRVSMTIETDDDDVRRQFTPTSPPVAARIRTLARLRAADVPTQAAVSPALPMNPERLARLLTEVADRVVLDTFHLGDGDWFDPDLHRRVLPAFLEVLGPERVGVGAGGFAGMNVGP
jgi:DNA repair photolyase